MYVCLEKIIHFNLVLACACFVLVLRKKEKHLLSTEDLYY